MKNKKEKSVLEKLSDFAFAMAIISICTVGICPAFSAIAIAVPLSMGSKGVEIGEDIKSKNRKSLIGGVIALALFVVDLAIIVIVKNKI